MLLITAQPIRNLRTPASADMNKRGFLEQASPPPLPNPPLLFPFLPIPYPLPLSTPATQASQLCCVEYKQNRSKDRTLRYTALEPARLRSTPFD